MVRILVEGTSDVPLVREVFVRGFGQVQGSQFQVFAHRGKGRLPKDLSAPPQPRDSTLLGQLPAKLRAFGKSRPHDPVVVLLDLDREDCLDLKKLLTACLAAIDPKPENVLFRIAVEELESWFISDTNAIRAAYPTADIHRLVAVAPDAIVGAWEELARSLGLKPETCSGTDKNDWAQKISPHLELKEPVSPSFRAFLSGIERITGLTA